jgi:hypothetical protein
MNQQLRSKQYITEKLTFAAYLIAANKTELAGTEPSGNGRNVLFLLSKPPTDDDVTQFFSGSATVSALRFSEAINTLKSVAYETRRIR